MSNLHCIIYTSTATKEFNTQELADLLAKSAAKNEKHGVTGILIFRNNKFIQVLEGENDSVDQVMARIRKDPRHTSVFLLERHRIAARNFTKWSMGFCKVNDDDISSQPNCEYLFSDEFGFNASQARFCMPLSILKAFAKHLE